MNEIALLADRIDDRIQLALAPIRARLDELVVAHNDLVKNALPPLADDLQRRKAAEEQARKDAAKAELDALRAEVAALKERLAAE